MTRNQRAILPLIPTDKDKAKDTHTLARELTEQETSAFNYDATYSILRQLRLAGVVERIGRPAAWYRIEQQGAPS
jgi:Fe2+ or Zn2+ uptake regulation protein